MANNELGHSDGPAIESYGINDVGVWTGNTQPWAFGEPDVVNAAKFSYDDLNLVDASTQSGAAGPLGGSTPASNPLSPEVVQAGQWSVGDFAGPQVASNSGGNSGPLGGSTPAENPLA